MVFTGGIGENDPDVRAGVCSDLTQLGIELDPEKNKTTLQKEGEINTKNSTVKILVIPTDEESAIAGNTYELVDVTALAPKARIFLQRYF